MLQSCSGDEGEVFWNVCLENTQTDLKKKKKIFQ